MADIHRRSMFRHILGFCGGMFVGQQTKVPIERVAVQPTPIPDTRTFASMGSPESSIMAIGLDGRRMVLVPPRTISDDPNNIPLWRVIGEACQVYPEDLA